jgi:protein-disulfide isomerase
MAVLKVPVTDDDHIQGNKDALITLVEYGDYECPYCGAAHPVVKKLQHHFGDQLRFVFRNFPLAEVHPFAKPAAETAEFAADHKRFWEMHDLLYENQANFSIPFFLELGEMLKLPSKNLALAIQQQAYEHKIQKDFMGGVRSGVNGTPTFFINGQRYNGDFDYGSLAGAIEEAMAI